MPNEHDQHEEQNAERVDGCSHECDADEPIATDVDPTKSGFTCDTPNSLCDTEGHELTE